MGVPTDVWAQGIERKLDAMAREHVDALSENALAARLLASEVRDGLAKVLDVLKTQDEHAKRIAAVERDHAALVGRVEKLERAATRRKK